MASRRISFLLGSFQMGGIERMCLNLSAGLSSRGYEVEIVALDTEGPLLEDVAEDVGIVQLSDNDSWLPGVFSKVGPLADYFDQRRPAVCLSENSHLNLVNILACLQSNSQTNSVVRENGLTPGGAFGTGRYWRERATQLLATGLYRRADCVVPVSQGVSRELVETIRLPADRLNQIYNPILTDDINDRATESVDHNWFTDSSIDVVLSVGRLEPAKDYQTLIEAFARVHADAPNTRLVILGEGSERDALERTAANLGVTDDVWIPGTVANPYKYMVQSSMFVLSSVSEGLPSVLVEALACECPVVATDCPHGPAEILNGGRYGRLVDPGDVAGLAHAILQTRNSPVGPDNVSTCVDRFTLGSVLDEYEHLITRHF
ncbi:glycosyltransferase [Halomicrobium sp. IBSBa]|uniref:glycosyltransferase n=1 Tax=Halomicrobium sp. IBSBa TaxID=2778916 RepID=UPI001AC00785|nr:glycosyltransferase [Halomicrobium sp. IBSBa]MBO4247097.1 glycosyltransferase [Halomicrobium sp. IBSBa]